MPNGSSAIPRRHPRGAAAEAADNPRPTVLIVDDEALVRETLTDLLEAEDYRVLAAESGQQVASLIGEADLVLLDAMLPDKDGWAVCRTIKEHDPLLPVLMVTARTSPEDVVRTFAAGADDYIAKPFNVAELSARIGTRLRAHEAERELQRANERLRDLADRNYELYQQAKNDAEERARLLRELDHRVRNNLSVIMGLVAMERNRRPPRPVEETLNSLENRLRSFVAVHETFRRDGYTGVPIGAVTERIAQRLRSTFDPQERIMVRVESDALVLDERRGFALALILNELLSNSLRHAFPDERRGTVTVRIHEAGDQVRAEVRDDGIGSSIMRQGSAPGSGRSIVEALLRGELGGTAEFRSSDPGTCILLRFPLRERLSGAVLDQ